MQVSWERSRGNYPDSEVPCDKHSKRSGPDEKAQKSPTVITVDSLERALDALPIFEGAAQDASGRLVHR